MSKAEVKTETFSKDHIIERLEVMEEDGVRKGLTIDDQMLKLTSQIIKFKTNEYLLIENHILAKFKALGNAHRIKIIQLLKEGILCSCELEFVLKLSQPTISHHLKILEEAKIINTDKRGKWNQIQLVETPLIFWILEHL